MEPLAPTLRREGLITYFLVEGGIGIHSVLRTEWITPMYAYEKLRT